MSVGGRAQARGRMLRRAWIITAVLVLLTLVLLLGGHWILAVIFGVGAAASIWALVQLRSVR
jgi:hypothetical protein